MTKNEKTKLARLWCKLNTGLGLLESEFSGKEWAGPALDTEEKRHKFLLDRFREAYSIADQLLISSK